jgi:hypothetical protein
MNPGDFRLPAPSPEQMMYFMIGFGAIILILVIIIVVNSKFHFKALSAHSIDKRSPRRFSFFTLHRISSELGLSRGQTKMLDFVLKCDHVADPLRSLSSPNLLDKHFKRAYKNIERNSKTNEEMNSRLSVLFEVRNIIDNASNAATTSTRQIPENTAAVLTIDNKNFPIRVISSQGDALVVENPIGSNGELLNPAKGSKANLSFFPETNKGFSVDSRVFGSIKLAGGRNALQLVHSGQIKKLSKRRYRRRQSVISTAFYFVRVEQGTRKKDVKMVLDKRKFSGNILDISIGGCSIKTTLPVSNGQRLKIEFTREDESVVAILGEVLRTSRSGINVIVNIKFIKIPRKSLNSINAFVYEYTDR